MGKRYLISDFLERFKRPIELESNKEYKLVTISSKHRGIKLRHLKKGGLIKSKMYEVKSGDFVLSGIDARNGAFGIIPEDLDGATITNDFWCLEINENIISKELFLELTATTWFDELCNRGSDGTTNRVRLQKGKFFNQEVVLPLKNEQEALLKKLLSVKNGASKLNIEIQTQKQLISQLKQAILQEAIQGKLTKEWREQNPNTEPASKLLERIKEEKEQLIKDKKIRKDKPLPPITENEIPFELPENWSWVRLGDIANQIHYGFNASAKPSKRDVRLLRITDIQNNSVIWENVPGCDCSEKDIKNYSLKENDIVIARTGGTIGKSYIVKNINVKSLFASYLIRVIPNTNYSADYLKLFIDSPIYWKQLYDMAWGAGQPNVNGTSLKSLKLPLPPLEEQKAIVEKVETLMQKCNALEQEITQSEQHANMLMQAVLKEAFEKE